MNNIKKKLKIETESFNKKDFSILEETYYSFVKAVIYCQTNTK